MNIERYVDIPHNKFDDFIREALLYNYRIVIKEYVSHENIDDGLYVLIGEDNLTLQYTEDDSDATHPIMVWFRSQAYDGNEWTYLDNISQDFYERRHGIC